MGQEIAERYQNVAAKIEAAKKRRTTVPKDAAVTLVAVTKNHDTAAMREAIAAGATDVGENRVQEAKGKFAEIGNGNINWDNLYKVSKEIGAEYIMIEQDTCDIDPRESMAISYRNLCEIASRNN